MVIHRCCLTFSRLCNTSIISPGTTTRRGLLKITCQSLWAVQVSSWLLVRFSMMVMPGPSLNDHLTGSDHQRHRKIMNPAFSAAHLRKFLPLFQRIGTKASIHSRRCPELRLISLFQMVDKWKIDLSGPEKMTVMVNKWFSRATLDIIGEGTSSRGRWGHCPSHLSRYSGLRLPV